LKGGKKKGRGNGQERRQVRPNNKKRKGEQGLPHEDLGEMLKKNRTGPCCCNLGRRGKEINCVARIGKQGKKKQRVGGDAKKKYSGKIQIKRTSWGGTKKTGGASATTEKMSVCDELTAD